MLSCRRGSGHGGGGDARQPNRHRGDSCRSARSTTPSARVARDYPDVETEQWLVDAMAARFVLKPETLEMVVASNLFADILSDLGSTATTRQVTDAILAALDAMLT